MLFITNRAIYPKNNGQFPRRIDFILEQNAPTQEIFFCERTAKNDYYEVGAESFLQSFAKSSSKQILLYIHGFNNLPEDNIFPNAEILQESFDCLEQNLVQVVPVIWPCDNDLGIIKDYWDDQMSSDMSGFSFKRALDFFRVWSKNSRTNNCYNFINVLTHSMGSRVLRETLQAWKKYSLPHGIPKLFRNIFLIAADLANTTLEHKERGEIICQAGRNVVVYYANDDLALRASKVINSQNMLASVRLGQTGPENMEKIPQNVYTVDCDEINNRYDFPKGHTYFLARDKEYPPNLVLQQVGNMLKTGRFSENIQERKIILR